MRGSPLEPAGLPPVPLQEGDSLTFLTPRWARGHVVSASCADALIHTHPLACGFRSQKRTGPCGRSLYCPVAPGITWGWGLAQGLVLPWV